MQTVSGLRPPGKRAALVALLRDGRLTLGLAAFLAVGGLAFANGGFFPVSWGWSGAALLWLAALALMLLSEVRIGRLEGTLLAALVALTGWIFLSALWTVSVPKTILEGERMLVYLGAIWAGVLLLRKASAAALLTGVWAAIALSCAYGLATRLFPQRLGASDQLAGYRLSEPLGYWNALGVIAAIGTLVALGLVARGRLAVRCLAASSAVVTLLTLYFTFSRGGWIAFFAGLAAAIALDPRRLQLVTTACVLAPWPALAILSASQSAPLTHQNASIEAAAKDGHGLAVIAIGLMVLAALTAMVLDTVERSLHVPRAVRRLYAALLVALLAAALAVTFERYGLPPTLARKAYSAFNTPPPQESSLTQRLFTFSGNGRSEQWHTAWRDVEQHPWLGSGAGTYDYYWFQHRRVALTVHDAHNLYLEALAELGPVGLLLLAAALGVPLVAATRARGSPLAAVALGAYVCYLLHAAVDWDWEMPAVTLAALFCGLALLASARREEPELRLRLPARLAGIGATAGLMGFALLGLLGNNAVSASSKAAHRADWGKAASEARRANDLAPWSSEPWRKLGEAQLGAGDRAAARTSFRRAIAKAPRDWSLWFELAAASTGIERKRALVQASLLNPLSPEIKAFRAGTRG